jgi:hypothetical protein
MSFLNKSDVKNHLSTKASGKPLSFSQRSQPDATGYSENEELDVKVTTPPSNAPSGRQAPPFLPVSALPIDEAGHKPQVEAAVPQKSRT